MQKEIYSIIIKLAEDVKSKMPMSYEKKYYSKMSYSNINDILTTNQDILHTTISFEVAFIHIVMYFFDYYLSGVEQDYCTLLSYLDNDKLFSWYKIDDSFTNEYLSAVDFEGISDIQDIINQHDTFIDKEIKKKLGQFYTPKHIVKSMMSEIGKNINNIEDNDFVIDPACGTGIFLIEMIERMKVYFPYEKMCLFVKNNLIAYDANPFAVLATKINLFSVLLLNYQEKRKEILSYVMGGNAFQNIKWQNTIVEDDERSYAIIFGNPPYFKLNNEMMKEIAGYEDVLYGQPNIYTVFMYWAIKHLKKDGIMSFIVPQSIRSGLYFKNIRAKINNMRIRSVVNIGSRQNIFDRAEQAVLIICLENKPILNSKTKIQFYNSEGKMNTQFKIPCSKLMLDKENNNVFILSRKSEMYNIFDKILCNSKSLQTELYPQKFSNGLFVWNQHKEDIVDLEDGAIPIIYGGNVQPINFTFTLCSSNNERKQYAKITDKTNSYVLNGKRLLIQRTTNFEKDIRLKSCIITDEFLNLYDAYFLENHVNFLCSEEGKSELVDVDRMYFFLGLLNSKILNYIFASKSGNTQVSANELNALPYPIEGEDSISQFVKRYEKDLLTHQKELDDLICTAYGLSDAEKKFIIEN